MPIILNLNRVMADRKISLNELARRVGIANVNLSNIKTGKISAIRFLTLEAICDVLDCQPGDLLEFRREGEAPEKEEKPAQDENPDVLPEYRGLTFDEMWDKFRRDRGWNGTYE